MLCSHTNDGINGHGSVIQDARTFNSWAYMLTRGCRGTAGAGVTSAAKSGGQSRRLTSCECTPPQ